MKLRIATWNINSVRLRVQLLERFVATFAPDILCLQEIKCRDELFPRDLRQSLALPHLMVLGQAGYHGVATLSKLPLAPLPGRSFCGSADARHLGCSFAAPGHGEPIALHNIYVPAGGDIPDPALNPKFKQKLAYLGGLAEWSHGRGRHAAILLGDFNVAPLETDVWSHKQLLKVVSHTPVEVAHLDRVRETGAWTDLIRRFIPPEERLYSWWSYRARDWQASDRGRRLDHIWATGLNERARGAVIVKEARGWAHPSDHAPVIADFAFG